MKEKVGCEYKLIGQALNDLKVLLHVCFTIHHLFN